MGWFGETVERGFLTYRRRGVGIFKAASLLAVQAGSSSKGRVLSLNYTHQDDEVSVIVLEVRGILDLALLR